MITWTHLRQLTLTEHSATHWSLTGFYLDFSSNQHGVEACLDLENAPPPFGNELRSQNDDESPALLHAAGQVLDVGWKTETCGDPGQKWVCVCGGVGGGLTHHCWESGLGLG